MKVVTSKNAIVVTIAQKITITLNTAVALRSKEGRLKGIS